jgi:hypothetical protein
MGALVKHKAFLRRLLVWGAPLLASGCLQDFDNFSAGEGDAVTAAVGGGGAPQNSEEAPAPSPSSSSAGEDTFDTTGVDSAETSSTEMDSAEANTFDGIGLTMLPAEETVTMDGDPTEASSGALSDEPEVPEPVTEGDSADLWDAQAPVQQLDAGDAGFTEQEDPTSDPAGTSDPETECPASCDAERDSCDVVCSRDEEQCLLECSGGQGQCRRTCADARELCELDCLRDCDECYQANNCAIACQ